MKIIRLLIIFLVMHIPKLILAQKGAIENRISRIKANIKAEKINIFLQDHYQKRLSIETNKSYFTLNKKGLESLKKTLHPLVEISLPKINGREIIFELTQTEILAPEFKIYDGSNKIIPHLKAKFYHGVIKDSPRSLVSIAIFDDSISGNFSYNSLNFSIQKVKGKPDFYEIINESLKEKQPIKCNTITPEGFKIDIENKGAKLQNTGCKVTKVFFEVDSTMFAALENNPNNVANYVYSMFIQVQTIFANADVAISLKSIKYWNTTDPYLRFQNIEQILTRFSSEPPPFNWEGEMRMLLSTRFLYGGIAYLNELCQQFLSCGVSSGMSSLSNYPNYSWSVGVVTHELGHIFGSPHTHSCNWPGGAIDNCYPVEFGGCPPGPSPASSGGSIMSYCSTIDFNLGFGPLPSALIKSRSNFCGQVDNTSPFNLYNFGTTATKTTLSWMSFSGSAKFKIQYKPIGSTVWQETSFLSGSVHVIVNLLPATNYEWRVGGECSTYYSDIETFTTNEAVYCKPTYTSKDCNAPFGIKSVILNNQLLNTDESCPTNSVNFYQTTTGKIILNGNNNISVSFHAVYAQNLTIWVDFDRSYSFEENEIIFYTQNSTTSVSEFFLLQGNFPVGTGFRMRILNKNAFATFNPCGTFSFGETEDYLVDVCTAPPPPLISPNSILSLCEPSLSLTATNCAGNIIWNDNNSLTTNPLLINQTGVYTAKCINSCGQSLRSDIALVIECCQNFSTTKSGAWNDPTIWTCGRIPIATDYVTINSGHVITVPSGTFPVKNITYAGGTIELGGGGIIELNP